MVSSKRWGNLLLLIGKSLKQVQTIGNVWFKNTLVVWNKVKRDFKITKELLMMRKIRGDPDFIPNRND